MIEGIPIVGLTAPTLLGIAILMILLGKLHTNPAYMEKAQEAKDWKAAYEKERDARELSDQQTVELLEVSKTNHSVTVAMFELIRRGREPGGPDDLPPE